MNTITTSTAALKTLFFVACLFTVSTVFAVNQVSTKVDNDVVYQSVSVRTTEKSVILDWKTTSETTNSYFEVERSNDMVSFKTVAIVLDGFEAEGNGKSYSFKESITKLDNGQAAYYRLKQVDASGIFSYSAVIKVAY